ncbi:MAG: hypothetical protein EZS28_001582, partial [Streblomastix strix]
IGLPKPLINAYGLLDIFGDVYSDGICGETNIRDVIADDPNDGYAIDVEASINPALAMCLFQLKFLCVKLFGYRFLPRILSSEVFGRFV